MFSIKWPSFSAAAPRQNTELLPFYSQRPPLVAQTLGPEFQAAVAGDWNVASLGISLNVSKPYYLEILHESVVPTT